MSAQSSQNDPYAKGFTRFSHSVFNALLLIDLNKRERVVIDLITRLTHGCHRQWAKLQMSELDIVGIGPTHAAEVMLPLLSKQLIIQNGAEKEYRLNEEKIIEIVTDQTGDKYEQLCQLVGKQLKKRKYSQISNIQITETVTKELPNEEVPHYHNGKSLSRGLASTKDILKYKFKDKERYKGDAFLNSSKSKSISLSNRIVDPNLYSPMNADQQAAKEVWLKLEPTKPDSFAFYLHAAKALGRDVIYRYASVIEQDSSIKNKGAVFVQKIQTRLRNMES